MRKGDGAPGEQNRAGGKLPFVHSPNWCQNLPVTSRPCVQALRTTRLAIPTLNWSYRLSTAWHTHKSGYGRTYKIETCPLAAMALPNTPERRTCVHFLDEGRRHQCAIVKLQLTWRPSTPFQTQDSGSGLDTQDHPVCSMIVRDLQEAPAGQPMH